MILSDREIQMEIHAGNLVFDPPVTDDDLATTAVDLHMGGSVGLFKEPLPGVSMVIDLSDKRAAQLIDPRQEGSLVSWQDIPDRGYPLNPGEFILSYTRERVTLPSHLAARVEGRSTLARFGIAIHSTAPTVHATFSGALTLEISNHGPHSCLMVPGMKVCQLIIERVTVPPSGVLQSRWMGQSPPTL